MTEVVGAAHPTIPEFPESEELVSATTRYLRAKRLLAAAERAEMLQPGLALERAVLRACDEVLLARSSLYRMLFTLGWEAPHAVLTGAMIDPDLARTPHLPLV